MLFDLDLLDLMFFSDGEEEGTDEPKAPEAPSDDDPMESAFDSKDTAIFGSSIDEDGPEDLTQQFITGEDQSPFDPLTEEDDKEPAPEPGKVSEPDAPEPPFRVLNYGGREVPIQSEADYDRLAAAGIEAEYIKRNVAPYAPYIVALERNPDLAREVENFILARLGSPQGQNPQEPPAPQDSDVEPEQDDDETFDEYEARLEKWREEKNARLIEQRVNDALSQRDRQAYEAQMTRVREQVVQHVNADPNRDQVMAVINSQPDSIKSAVFNDPRAFMMFYDQVCRIQGREGHFGAPVPGAEQTNQKGGDAVSKPNKGGRTVVKSKQQVPFAERGGVSSSARAASGLPDFKRMSEAEFDKIYSRVKSAGM